MTGSHSSLLGSRHLLPLLEVVGQRRDYTTNGSHVDSFTLGPSIRRTFTPDNSPAPLQHDSVTEFALRDCDQPDVFQSFSPPMVPMRRIIVLASYFAHAPVPNDPPRVSLRCDVRLGLDDPLIEIVSDEVVAASALGRLWPGEWITRSTARRRAVLSGLRPADSLNHF